jgi:hypothetical protein
MNPFSRWMKKLKKVIEQPDEVHTFCCVYGNVERPRCWEHRSHLAKAEIDCAYHAVREGYPSGIDQPGACPRFCGNP